MYHNTTQETATQVIAFSQKTKKQDDLILEIATQMEKPFSAKDIYKRYPIANVPITSIRRAINTLFNKYKIVRTGNKVEGLYGKPEYQYKII